MTGLFLLAAAALWVYVLKWLVQVMTNRLPDRPWRLLVKWCVFALLLPLPLIDEIVGGMQFAALCKRNVVHVNKGTARGKTVYLESASKTPIKGTWVRVWSTPYRFVDAMTGELVLSYEYLRAEGGALFPGFDSWSRPHDLQR